jgi:hypothetical protein
MPVESGVEAAFAAGLLNPAAPVPPHVKGQAVRRYAVYRNNVTVGLVRALEANFPAIRRLLGEAYFAGLARAFAQAHPPRSPLLFHYGANFPAYLAAQDDLAAYPYLADVARLEQLWRRAYHAADAPTLAPEELAGLDEAAMADLRLDPSSRLCPAGVAACCSFHLCCQQGQRRRSARSGTRRTGCADASTV